MLLHMTSNSRSASFDGGPLDGQERSVRVDGNGNAPVTQEGARPGYVYRLIVSSGGSLSYSHDRDRRGR